MGNGARFIWWTGIGNWLVAPRGLNTAGRLSNQRLLVAFNHIERTTLSPRYDLFLHLDTTFSSTSSSSAATQVSDPPFREIGTCSVVFPFGADYNLQWIVPLSGRFSSSRTSSVSNFGLSVATPYALLDQHEWVLKSVGIERQAACQNMARASKFDLGRRCFTSSFILGLVPCRPPPTLLR